MRRALRFFGMAEGAPRYDDLKLHLRVLDADHEITARARIGPTRVMELLPLARAISEGVSAIAVAYEQAEGKAISCKAGCAACCRFLVPIAPAEAVRLSEVVEAMPKERRRAVKKRFEKAVQRMEQIGLLDPRRPRGQAALRSVKTDPTEAWEDASRRYFEARIGCPLLEDEACGAYAERPMVCREYSVTTPAELCSKLSHEARDVPRPVHMSEVMTAVTNELLGREDLGVPLAMALEWAAAHRERFRAEGDGEEMAMTLVRGIQAASD
jgi:Fe-S-cluster containining protein